MIYVAVRVKQVVANKVTRIAARVERVVVKHKCCSQVLLSAPSVRSLLLKKRSALASPNLKTSKRRARIPVIAYVVQTMPLKVQSSRGLGPSFQIELLKTDRVRLVSLLRLSLLRFVDSLWEIPCGRESPTPSKARFCSSPTVRNPETEIGHTDGKLSCLS